MADGTDFTITKDTAGNIKIVTVEKVSTYDPLISLKKLLGQVAVVGGIAALTYLAEVGLPQLSLELPEYVAFISVATGIVTFVLNYLKHKNDSEIVKKEITPKEI